MVEIGHSSVLWVSISSEALEIRPTSLYDIISSLTGFSMTPKRMTLIEPEWPFYVCDDNHFAHFEDE